MNTAKIRNIEIGSGLRFENNKGTTKDDIMAENGGEHREVS